MIALLIHLLLVIIVFGIVWYALTKIPLPPPFNWMAQLVLLVIFLLVIVAYVLPGMRLSGI